MIIKNIVATYYAEVKKTQRYINETLMPYLIQRTNAGKTYAVVEIPVWFSVTMVAVLLSEFGVFIVEEDGKRVLLAWGDSL